MKKVRPGATGGAEPGLPRGRVLKDDAVGDIVHRMPRRASNGSPVLRSLPKGFYRIEMVRRYPPVTAGVKRRSRAAIPPRRYRNQKIRSAIPMVLRSSNCSRFSALAADYVERQRRQPK